MGVSKNRGKPPKMDGENNGKPYFLMDDLGIPLSLETPIWKTRAVTTFGLLGCPRKLGSMVRINGLFSLLINGVYWGDMTHLQTIY